MQRRRFLFSAALAAPLLTTACSGRTLPRQLSMTTAQLQAKVASKFPRPYPVAGLLPVQLSGPVLKQSFQGQLDVSFGLRYEPSDRTLRAQRVVVNSLQIADAPPALTDMLSTYGPRLGEQVLENLALHQFEDKDLALADTIGLQPGAITVTAQGLTMALDKKTS